MRASISARDYFPRGLFQPSGSFRFSMDALLLSAFAARMRREDTNRHDCGTRLLDLGCGCGVVGFGCMILQCNTVARGLDAQAELVEAAMRNSALLGFENSYAAYRADLEQVSDPACFTAIPGCGNPFDLVTANPPYRVPGSGREPSSMARRAALFGGPENLRAFCRAAALALKDGGLCCMIFPFARTSELCDILAQHGLMAEKLLTVTTRPEQGPLLSLVAARKKTPGQTAQKPLNLPGLLIYSTSGRLKSLSAEALEFCPFLDPARAEYNSSSESMP